MQNTRIKILALFLILLAGSLGADFVQAAEPGSMPLTVDGKERVCLDCHHRANIQSNEGALASQALCFECHGREGLQRQGGQAAVSLRVTPESFAGNRHQVAACVACHVDVARSPHRTRVGAQCLSCHTVHGEGTAHDPHLRVSCQACHRQSSAVTLNRTTDRVVLSRLSDRGLPLSLADHRLPDTGDPEFCQRCHVPGNQVGAAAAVLPAKSLLCLPCHYAPIAVGHSLFWTALAVFGLGLLLTGIFWFSGSVQGEEKSFHRKLSLGSEAAWSALFSRQFWTILKTFFLDVLLQRRILQESVKRWSIHSLIYYAILLRFGLALFTHFAYFFKPGGALAYALIDKNHPFVALLNDLLGLFILLGLAAAVIQRFIVKPPHVVSEWKDNWALAIIGALVLVGFLLEGARILVTQIPAEKAAYSFVGYLLSLLFAVFPADWPATYVYFWYAHAILGALLVAYLPFGKLKHIFVTPLSLVSQAKKEE
ncbi:MAG: respiratory nitrate reductase subunit gamma [Deltaproteobacteria bacterium]|nr:respiratory nitrate reductase subunit gamma [Deltaproteobacteria bacterium]